MAKTENYVYYIFNENICSACNPMQINFAAQRFKFSHFEGSIICYVVLLSMLLDI